jgi:hypothetical protein
MLTKMIAQVALPIALLSGGAATFLFASNQEEAAPAPPPMAATEDVESLDAIIAALYDVISGEKIGPEGQNQRDWDRFLSLFHPELGRLIPLRANAQDPENPKWQAMGMAPADYVTMGKTWMSSQAFYEKEVHRVEEVFGGIAHVWSTYEGRDAKDAETPMLRGVNSIQAMFDGDRWWILVVAWDAERPDQPLPAKYLPDAK